MTTVKTWQVPFVNGNHKHYVDSWLVNRGDVIFVDPYEFDDELRVVSYEKGQSRVTIRLKSLINSKTYECTLDKFFDMLHFGTITQREPLGEGKFIVIAGKFGFKKIGSTITIYLVGHE